MRSRAPRSTGDLPVTFFPGDPAQIRELAARLRDDAALFGAASETLQEATPRSWSGETAENAKRRIAGIQASFDAARDNYRRVASALDTYAKRREACENAAQRLLAQSDGLENQLLPATPSTQPALNEQLRSVRSELDAVIDEHDSYVRELAGEIAAATDGLGLPDEGQQLDEAAHLETVDVIPVSGQVDLSETAFTPTSVVQHGIAPSGYFAALAALSTTDSGRDLLRQQVRWDSTRGGYWVTLHGDTGPSQYLVTTVRSTGQLSDGASAGWADIYVDAFDQHLRSSGGSASVGPEAGLRLLAGAECTGYANPSVNQIRADLDSGAAVTTRSAVVDNLASSAALHAQVKTVDGVWVHQEIDLVDDHVYAVVSVDEHDTVELFNPAGVGNVFDGGQFRLPRDVFEHAFTSAAVASGTGRGA